MSKFQIGDRVRIYGPGQFDYIEEGKFLAIHSTLAIAAREGEVVEYIEDAFPEENTVANIDVIKVKITAEDTSPDCISGVGHYAYFHVKQARRLITYKTKGKKRGK